MRKERSSAPLLAGILGGVALLFVIGIILNFIRGSNTIDYSQYTQSVDTTEGLGAIGYALGDPEAPHTIVVYSDFACPACFDIKSDIDETITTHVANGEARLVYKILSYTNPPYSVASATAAHCSGQQGEFWAMYDQLWTTFQRTGPTSFRAAALDRHAADIESLNQPTYQDCLNSDATKAALNNIVREATRREIEAAPAVFVDGERIGIGGDAYNAITEALAGE